jgi:chemotaxis family two-component system sensor kinase Cph1
LQRSFATEYSVLEGSGTAAEDIMSNHVAPITGEDLHVGEHVAYFFRTNEERLAFVVPYMTAGLHNFERCIYIADENTVPDILAKFSDAGVDVGSATANGALSVVTKHDSYLRHGAFEPERMIDDLDREVRLALQLGFSGVRVTGEMSWALDLPSVLVRLCDYEEALRRHWPAQLSGLCQYNERMFPGDVVKRMASCHGTVVRDGKITRHATNHLA